MSLPALLAASVVGLLAAGLHQRVPMGRTVATRPPRRRRRAQPPDAEAWAALLDAAAAEVRAGASLATAWQVAVARHPCAGRAAEAGAGHHPEGGVDADEAVVRQVVRAAAELGGPVAATLDAGASVLRERSAARAEALAHSAQARLSARVLTAVPVAFAGWSIASSESIRGAMLSLAGMAAAALGGVLNVVGWWWMRRIVAGAAR